MNVDVVDAFLAGGGSLCPFARTAVLHHARVGERGPVEAFASTAGRTPAHALIVHAAREPRTFAEARAFAREAFLDLAHAFGLLSGFPAKIVKRHVRDVVRPSLDAAQETRAFLACHNEPLYAIGMAPFYASTHPRHAPRAILVVTWHRDVEIAANAPGVLTRIRAAMAAGHGELYDADELMLPPPRASSARAGGARVDRQRVGHVDGHDGSE